MSVFKKSKKLDFSSSLKNIEEGIANIPPLKKRRKKAYFLRFLKYFSFFVVATFLFFALTAIIIGISVRQVMFLAASGKNNIELSLDLAKQRDFGQALHYAKQAKADFSKSKEIYAKTEQNFIAKHIPFVNTQLHNGGYLLSAADMLSDSMIISIEFYQNLQNILSKSDRPFSEITKDEKRTLLGYIYQSSSRLIAVKKNLDLSLYSLKKISLPKVGLTSSIEEKLSGIESQVESATKFVDKAIPASKLIPELLGYPAQKSYLFLLQNHTELRPTGGFIGTYGIIVSDSGEFSRFDTHDIYHLDMPVKDKFGDQPPPPLEKYLGIKKLYLRDSNWAPDFPVSAKQAQYFFKAENELHPEKDPVSDFDGVIAVTPKLIEDLLGIIGPITIENITYNKDNFTQVLEYRVEMGFTQLGVSRWQRKEVIGSIAKELKKRLFDLEPDKWPYVLTTLFENMAEKDVLVYFDDQSLEQLAVAQGIAGEMQERGGDFLMVVDCNTAAMKTDAAVNKSVDYTIQQRTDGLYGYVKLKYAHKGEFDYRTTRYRSYTRLFVPRGSVLIKASGISQDSAYTGEEFGKTVFGAFIQVEPGQIGELAFLYKLPANLNDNLKKGGYSLLLQKQPGRTTEETAIDLQFMDVIKSYSPANLSAQKPHPNQILWKTDMDADKFFEITTIKQDK